jgi:ATP-binding cassette subfamily B protein
MRTNVQKIGWRERAKAFRNVGPLFRLALRCSRKYTIASILVRLVRAALPVLALWIGKLILDDIISIVAHRGAPHGHLYWLIAFEFAIAVASDTLVRVATLLDSLLADTFTNYVNVEIIGHASALDLSFYEQPVFYDKLDRARSQMTSRIALVGSLLNMLQETATVAMLSTAMLAFSPLLVALLTLATLATLPALVGDNHFVALKYSVLFRAAPLRRQLDYLRNIGSSPESAKEVRTLRLGAFLTTLYQTRADAIFDENKHLALRRVSLGSLLTAVSTLAYYGGYLIVLSSTIHAQITIGMFTFLTGAFARSRSSIQRITAGISDVTEHGLFLTDLFDFLAVKPTLCCPRNPARVPRELCSGLEFRNVTFRYPGCSRPALEDVSFAASPGDNIAIVGVNGSGKTTLIKLIARLYDPSSGIILLDGIDLRDYDPYELRRAVSIMFQDFVRYEMTARENVGIGDVENLADHSRVARAVISGGAGYLVRQLPRGLDQVLGHRFEGGVDLSAGEWQKIGLARAFMPPALIRILDEPSANLDAIAERNAFTSIAADVQGRISIVVSHRLSTIRSADKIVLLHSGKVDEEGTHAELMALGGQYAEMFELQAAAYK